MRRNQEYQKNMNTFLEEYNDLVEQYRCFIGGANPNMPLILLSMDEAIDKNWASEEDVDQQLDFYSDNLQDSVDSGENENYGG
jgi:hypothetical protein